MNISEPSKYKTTWLIGLGIFLQVILLLTFASNYIDSRYTLLSEKASNILTAFEGNNGESIANEIINNKDYSDLFEISVIRNNELKDMFTKNNDEPIGVSITKTSKTKNISITVKFDTSDMVATIAINIAIVLLMNILIYMLFKEIEKRIKYSKEKSEYEAILNIESNDYRDLPEDSFYTKLKEKINSKLIKLNESIKTYEISESNLKEEIKIATYSYSELRNKYAALENYVDMEAKDILNSMNTIKLQLHTIDSQSDTSFQLKKQIEIIDQIVNLSISIAQRIRGTSEYLMGNNLDHEEQTDILYFIEFCHVISTPMLIGTNVNVDIISDGIHTNSMIANKRDLSIKINAIYSVIAKSVRNGDVQVYILTTEIEDNNIKMTIKLKASGEIDHSMLKSRDYRFESFDQQNETFSIESEGNSACITYSIKLKSISAKSASQIELSEKMNRDGHKIAIVSKNKNKALSLKSRLNTIGISVETHNDSRTINEKFDFIIGFNLSSDEIERKRLSIYGKKIFSFEVDPTVSNTSENTKYIGSNLTTHSLAQKIIDTGIKEKKNHTNDSFDLQSLMEGNFGSDNKSLRGYKIIVSDTDKNTLSIMHSKLTMLGAMVTTSSSVNETCKHIQTLRADLAIVNFDNLEEMADQITKSKENSLFNQNICIIALSASPKIDKQIRDKIASGEIDAVMIKPFEILTIMHAIKKYAQKSNNLISVNNEKTLK